MSKILAETADQPVIEVQPLSLLRRMLRLAWPLMLAQAAFLGMNATDTLVVGRYSAISLAGVGLGTSVLIPGYCLLMGMCLAVAPGVARQLGAGVRQARLAEWVGGALLLGTLAWTLLMLVLQFAARPLEQALAPEPAVAEELVAYLRWGTLGYPFAGLFFVLRNVVEAHGHSRPIMWLGLGALLLNIPLDFVLVFGWGPIPALGASGCGLATSLVQMLLGLGVWAYYRRSQELRPLSPRLGLESRQGARDLRQLGLPVGLALLAESSLFALGGLLMVRFGTAAIAAHQICNVLAALAFMMQVGIGQATAVMVGHALGARDAEALRGAARVGALLGLGFAAVVLLIYWQWGSVLVNAFSTAPEVRTLGAILILWAAAFHIFDATQAIFAAALRGLHDTRAVMLITIFCYAAIAVPAMLYWVQLPSAKPAVIWWAYTLGLALAASFLLLRFVRKSRMICAEFAAITPEVGR